MQQENLKQKEGFKFDLLNRELCSKRFNFLIYGLLKEKMFRWETRCRTLAMFYRFVEDGLKIKPENLHVEDIHTYSRPVDSHKRLPVISSHGDFVTVISPQSEG